MTNKLSWPRCYLIWIVVLGVVGSAISIYSIVHHHAYLTHGVTDAICNINAVWSCDTIAASSYSELFTLPLGVWGLGFFLSLVVIAAILMAKKPLTNQIHSHLASLVVLSYVGLVVSVVLAVISGLILKSYCLSCIGVYAVNFGLAIVSTVYLVKKRIGITLWKKSASGFDTRPWSGCMSAAMIVAITFAGYYYLAKPRPHPSDFADHPKQNEIKRQQNAIENNLGSVVYDIQINRSPYQGAGEDYRIGPDFAPITIVEYIDYECPACARMVSVAKKLVDMYPDSVSVVLKNFPLNSECNSAVSTVMHKYACELAVLSRCAGTIGQFWSFHDYVFAQQPHLKDGKPQQWAKEMGMTAEQIRACLASDDLAAKISSDVREAQSMGVQGTPSLFINGRKYMGLRSLDTMAAVVDTLLISQDSSSSSSQLENQTDGTQP